MHYAVWVVVGAEGDAIVRAGQRLERFDAAAAAVLENVTCACVGTDAADAVEVDLAADHAPLRADLHLAHAAGDVAGAETVAARIRAEVESRIHLHPLRDAPDRLCGDCGGIGSLIDVHNPDGRWDWWQAGGDWSGVFDPRGAGRDVIGAGELAAALSAAALPQAVIDDAGAWHDAAFIPGDPQAGDAAWMRTLGGILAAAPAGARVVVIDCHR